ncbi:MAG: hypothetical protein P4L53_21395 [Candidatus Obscuribacterales bacterium]|nr:hypothetical protein [Candidatus Obscuribacterales bacterium]
MKLLRSSVYGWKSVWMDLTDEMNGEFEDGTYAVKAKLPLAGTPLSLFMQMHTHPMGQAISETTVLALPFNFENEFQFAVHNSSAVEEVAKILGLQDIVVGDADFDKTYIIQGSDPRLVQKLFSDSTFKMKIQEQKSCNLSIVDSHHKQFGIMPPKGVGVLTFVEKGAVNSFERLTSLVELMALTHKHLQTLGVAAEAAPEYEI